MATIRIKSTLRKRGSVAPGTGKRFEALLRALGLPEAEVSVLFAGDRTMRGLNRKYRARDRTTDVLSFSLREGRPTKDPSGLLGDIVISVPVAVRQARAAGSTLQAEIERLLVHGLLHLLGFDHVRGEREAKRMERQEQRAMRLLQELSR